VSAGCNFCSAPWSGNPAGWNVYPLAAPFFWQREQLPPAAWARVLARPGHYIACPDCHIAIAAGELDEVVWRGVDLPRLEMISFLAALVDEFAPPITLTDFAATRSPGDAQAVDHSPSRGHAAPPRMKE
jgi:hypothetical protein